MIVIHYSSSSYLLGVKVLSRMIYCYCLELYFISIYCSTHKEIVVKGSKNIAEWKLK